MAQQALDTFVAEVDGAPFAVQKGAVFPDSHPLVKLDAGRGVLFAPLDLGDEEKPPEKPARASAKAAS